MTQIEEQLAAIGFGNSRRQADCWRAVRIGRPAAAARTAEAGPEPGCSRALRRWRALLARNSHPSPYRISRA